MDALIYTAMSGAERVLRAQQVHANNLANADTPGFRANLELSSSRQVEGAGYAALGRDDRLADVNAELKRVGASPIEGAKRAASRGAAGRQTR